MSLGKKWRDFKARNYDKNLVFFFILADTNSILYFCTKYNSFNTSLAQLTKFPVDFVFGAATASYQIEGAWDKDGKGENIWDHLTHTRPDVIIDLSNGDVAADSYHKYKRDVEMMRELNLDAYRFSISWPRILPTGFPNIINQAGIDYYHNLIDEMLKYNIQPHMTIYHWDLPQRLQDLGGWTNPNIVDWFADYARVVFENFSDKVKQFITFNEPNEICNLGYEARLFAPLINGSGVGIYLCAKNLILAHAKAYHIYDEEYKPKYNGKCGITIHTYYFESEKPEYEEKTELCRQSIDGIYAHPIFNGDFPPLLKKAVAEKSAEQGFARSRLPELSQEEIDYIVGTADFYGLNHYTGEIIYSNDSVTEVFSKPSLNDDVGVLSFQVGKVSNSPWLYLVPDSLYNVLSYVKKNYGNPIIYITENGWSTTKGLDDDDRALYYRVKLAEVLKAINDGIRVQGYTAWSLMDNFEWIGGYEQRFGLYEVDFENPDRPRTPRKSAFVYKEIVRTRSVVSEDYEPEKREMWIEKGH